MSNTTTTAGFRHDYTTLLGVYDNTCALRDHIGARGTAARTLCDAPAARGELLDCVSDVVDELDELLDLRHHQLVRAADADLALVHCVSLFDERVDTGEMHGLDDIADALDDIFSAFVAWSTAARHRLAFTRDTTLARDRSASRLLGALTLANKWASMSD